MFRSAANLCIFSKLLASKDTEVELCTSLGKALVIDINGAGKIQPNKQLTLEVIFIVSNGCGTFNSFLERKTGTTRII